MKLLPALGAALLLLVTACRRDVSLEPPPYTPTPYPLHIPEWATANGHLPFFPADIPLTKEMVDLGRRLFHERALSDDRSLSCASCHRQEHAFTDPRPFSMGTNGALGPRNAMAIVNLAWDNRFFWDGRSFTLEQQAFLPVVDHAELRNTWPEVERRLRADPAYPERFRRAFGDPRIDSVRIVQAIAQFERTLLSFNSRYDQFVHGGNSSALTPSEQWGMDLFFRGAHCGDCHMAPLFTDHSLRNNGLDLQPLDPGLAGVTGNPAHVGRFKTPTLRNIAVTGPYMHDSRFTTLEEVVDFYADGVQVGSPLLDNHMFPWMTGQVVLSAQDRADLVAFLHALTDTDFLTDTAFAAPR